VVVTFNILVGGRKKSSKDTYSSSLHNALLYVHLKGAGQKTLIKSSSL